MMRSQEITGGFIITEHYKGVVVNFYWFDTLKEAEKWAIKYLEKNESTYIISEVVTSSEELAAITKATETCHQHTLGCGHFNSEYEL